MHANERNDNPLNDHTFTQQLREQLLQFAKLQLNNEHQAEDVVQDALEGAMKNAASFSGKAAWKSWVFAILRNKIADQLRRHYREKEAKCIDNEDTQDFDALFDDAGYWPASERPQRWPAPDKAMEQDQFWLVFDICLNDVPSVNARAFMMREFVGLETQEICQAMGVTTTNLNVILWRARMRLRECLSQRWFNGEK